MQAWGTQSRFTVRDTGLEPSKSGVVGLLCAAMGRGRENPLDDLDALCMGVRIDREGLMAKDYHTAIGVMKADGKRPPEKKPKHPKFTVISNRYYLADADFTVGLAGDDLNLLGRINEALQNPRWPLFLGRKSFPPGISVWIPGGLLEGVDLETSLRNHPWDPGFLPKKRWPERLRLVMETAYGKGETVRCDQPVSFEDRRFALRYTRTKYINVSDINIKEEISCTSLD
jgi:CRISPR system Cascade subunit CasD